MITANRHSARHVGSIGFIGLLHNTYCNTLAVLLPNVFMLDTVNLQSINICEHFHCISTQQLQLSSKPCELTGPLDQPRPSCCILIGAKKD